MLAAGAGAIAVVTVLGIIAAGGLTISILTVTDVLGGNNGNNAPPISTTYTTLVFVLIDYWRIAATTQNIISCENTDCQTACYNNSQDCHQQYGIIRFGFD